VQLRHEPGDHEPRDHDPEDPDLAHRDRWDDASNTVAIEPGVVVTYERNTGIEVMGIAGLSSARDAPEATA
jgi:arginine deiminase